MLFKKPKEKQYISRSFFDLNKIFAIYASNIQFKPTITQCLDILIKTLLAITTWDHKRC